jgi:dCMP deaminase
MPNQVKLDKLYMDICFRVAKMSHAKRLKVGAVLVKGDNIISMGWNGTPTGMSNECEIVNPDGSLSTSHEVLHSESNCLMKKLRNGGDSTVGTTLYCTDSACVECAKLINQAGVLRFVYSRPYRITDGIEFLVKTGIQVDHLEGK